VISFISLHSKKKYIGELERHRRELSQELSQTKRDLSKAKAASILANDRIKELEAGLLYNPSRLVASTVSAIRPRPVFEDSLTFKVLMSEALLDDCSFLNARALRGVTFISPPDVRAKIKDSSGLSYTVTLNSCSCSSFLLNHRPCKHMLWLAMEVGVVDYGESPSLKDVEKLQDKIDSFIANSPFKRSAVFSAMSSDNLLHDDRFMTAYNDNSMRLIAAPKICARVRGQSENVYDVTLDSCTCKDYVIRKRPCKHMYRLGLSIGALSVCDCSAINKEIKAHQKQIALIENESSRLKKDRAAAVRAAEITIRREKDERTKTLELIRKSNARFMSKLNNFGYNSTWIAKLYGDYYDIFIGNLVKELDERVRPARSTAARIEQNCRQEMKKLAARTKRSEDIVFLYETFYPNLPELCDMRADDVPPSLDASSEEPKTEYETMRRWISRSEYDLLSREDKYQLALENYKHRKRSNWEAGRDFERYICYVYEKQGYRVVCFGALNGLADLGRDLYAFKNNDVYIIQCKRWSSQKLIHEKHIYQLFGTVTDYSIDHPNLKVTGLLISTCELSDKAKEIADRIGIKYQENIPFPDYPLVKCNIGRSSGEKIYHLPFDQQYDTVQVEYDKGECYVDTIKEAERKGFRRAHRHICNSEILAK